MKPIMYHYVRPKADGLPYFPYLSLADFERQLERFERDYGFVSREEFLRWTKGGPAPEGVLLTFDDGLRDHADFVLPALRARGLFGLFYVSSGPAVTGRILDVHKVHLALGRLGGPQVLAWLREHARDLFSSPEDSAGEEERYRAQDSDTATKFVKYLFNWKLTEEAKGEILDALLAHAFGGRPPEWREIYLGESDIRNLIEAGMGVGPHGHSHEVTSRLSLQRQREEVDLSCDFVERFGGSRAWGYCYPFGAPAAYSRETEEIVARAGCPLAFAVASEDIVSPLALSARYALPRHNCNAFPHGMVSYG